MSFSPTNPEEDQHLADDHGLIKTTAYIPGTKKKRSSGAARTQKHRDKKRNQGIAQVDVPIYLANAIKSAGSYESWKKQYQFVPIEKYNRIEPDLSLTYWIEKLPKWKRWIINILLD